MVFGKVLIAGGVSRDSKLSKLSWKGSEGKMLELRQSVSDVSLWRVCLCNSGTLTGTVGVYVDDLLLMTADRELPGLIKAIRDTWKCSEPSVEYRLRKLGRICGFTR